MTVAARRADAPATHDRTRDERFCDSTGGVRLCFETTGKPSNPTLLLIMGLGGQLITWPDDLCELLAERGFHVVRFDNRDCGASTHLDHIAPPKMLELATRRIRRPGYTLADMAGDAVALLDHLHVDAAHVVGTSMGGMIAQTLAVTHSTRVRSLTSMMSNTGSLRTGQPAPALWRNLLRPVPTERGPFIARMSNLLRSVASPAYAVDEQALHAMVALSFDRGVSQAGTTRQLAAVLAAGDRTDALRTITAPTLVIHGRADRLVAPSGGRATAAAIPQASLLELDGMGHDLPHELWPTIADAIAANAKRGRDRTHGAHA